MNKGCYIEQYRKRKKNAYCDDTFRMTIGKKKEGNVKNLWHRKI